MKEIAIQEVAEPPTGSPETISLFPDFLLGAMARRGPGVLEAVDVDAPQAPPTRWVFHPADRGVVETIAETRRAWFRAILARFGHLCGISPYGGEAELSVDIPLLGTRQFSVVLANAQQTGFSVRIWLFKMRAPAKEYV